MSNLCSRRVVLLGTVIVTLVVSIIYIYNVRIEGMKVKYDCPTSLEQTNDGLFKLSYKNNKKPPNYYYNLDEYINLIDFQKEKNMGCPVLSLNSNNSNLTPAVVEQNYDDEDIDKLMDANISGDGYNINQYPGFDPTNLYIGMKTPLDLLHDTELNNDVSANPMDSNWGGNSYTSELVESGFYKSNSR
jgi:hypothetical protein